jgi:beta-lactam-binding protein with PASTA domain
VPVGGLGAPTYGGPPAGYEEVPNRNGLYAILGFVALVVLIIGGILLYNALNEGGEAEPEPTTVAIPNVVGQDLEEATQTIVDAGLAVEPVPFPNPDVPENQVFQTDPLPDVVVERDSVVRLIYNPPAEDQPVPNVVGLIRDEAEQTLTGAGFTIGEVTSETSDQPVDTVLSTDPPAETLLEPGAPVNIVLSAGPNTNPVPNVVGQTESDARATLEGEPYLYVVTAEDEASTEVEEGRVIRTDPGVGSDIAVGGPITIFVSTGPEQTTVPPVVGLTEAQARTQLQADGLVPDVQYVNVAAGDANDGLVISQNPTAGTEVDPNSTVRLRVGRAVAAATTTTSTTTTTTTTLPPTTLPPTTLAPTTLPPTTPPPTTIAGP